MRSTSFPITTAVGRQADGEPALIGRLARRVVSDLVADAPHSLNRGPAERAVDLVAERANIDLEDPGVHVGGVIPDVLDQLGLGEHVTRMSHEKLEQRELSRCQPDLVAAALDLMPGRVQRQIPSLPAQRAGRLHPAR